MGQSIELRNNLCQEAIDLQESARAEIREALQVWLNGQGIENFTNIELAAILTYIGETRFGDLLKSLSQDFNCGHTYVDRPSVHLVAGEDGRMPDIYLLGWRSSDVIEGTPVHDHGISRVVVKVIEGTVQEEVYEVDKCEWQKIEKVSEYRTRLSYDVTSRSFNEPQTFAGNVPHIHAITASGPGLAITLHAYYPPLNQMTLFTRVDNCLQPDGMWVNRS